jgi:imidazolonepropionase-like amidohydrolase
MLRLRGKYQRLVHGDACACSSPLVQQSTRKLSEYSRRSFLAGLGSVAVAATWASVAGAQSGSPNPKILFTKARLFDGKSDALKAGVQILLDGERISEIDTANSPAPSGATVIDCGDRVITPGLIDAHWHMIYAALPLQVLMAGDPGIIFAAATAEAERTLMRGFTTVRDLGGPVFAFKQAIDSGIIPGPRIFPAGAMITTSGGHGDLRQPFEIPSRTGELSLSERMGTTSIADDIGALKRGVREQLLQGASQIKLVGGGGVSSPRSPLDMSTFSQDEIRAAVDVASDWNTYVTVHAYAPNTVQRAVAGGVACVEHGHLMDEETAVILAAKEVWLSTQPFLTADDVVMPVGPGAARVQQLFAGTPRIYELARKHGIKTAWGSDLLFSPQLTPRQNIMLTHLRNWYSSAEALKMATSTNAQLLALSNLRAPYDGKLGVVEPGAFADILVWDGNPLDDLGLIETPERSLKVIVKNGKVHKNTI